MTIQVIQSKQFHAKNRQSKSDRRLTPSLPKAVTDQDLSNIATALGKTSYPVQCIYSQSSCIVLIVGNATGRVIQDVRKVLSPCYRISRVDKVSVLSVNRECVKIEISKVELPPVNVEGITHVSVIRNDREERVQVGELVSSDRVKKVFKHAKDVTRKIFKSSRAHKGVLFRALGIKEGPVPVPQQHPTPKTASLATMKSVQFVKASSSDILPIEQTTMTPNVTPQEKESPTAINRISVGCSTPTEIYSQLEDRYLAAKITASPDTIQLVIEHLAALRVKRRVPKLLMHRMPPEFLELKLHALGLPVEEATLTKLLYSVLPQETCEKVIGRKEVLLPNESWTTKQTLHMINSEGY